MSVEAIVFHVEIEEFGDTMEAFMVQKSPDPNGVQLLQLVFDNMPQFKFQLHWRDGTTIETLNVRKHDPLFHKKVEVAIARALQVFIANDFVGM
jgi:hypothetical protein